jgi:superfamily I DNA and/or RNA helicase
LQELEKDEADVIVLSLVLDSFSKTPFVQLQNRMIVMLSRARLGFYIVGNRASVDTTRAPHWKAQCHHSSNDLFLERTIPLYRILCSRAICINFLDNV